MLRFVYIKRILLLLLISLCGGMLPAQSKRTGIWYFGDKAGLNFNTTPPTPLTDGQMSTAEGCASICDTNGNLLFYSDGRNVWNRKHQIMVNGDSLMGHHSSAQSAIIVPFPDNDSLFYLFTIDAANLIKYGLRYSVINMNLDNGNGAITEVKNQLIYANTIEKITAVRHANGKDCWVIIQQLDTNIYHAYLINSAGIQAPVISSVGSTSKGLYILKASPQGNKIATTHNTFYYPTTGNINVFDFDNVTGILSNPIILDFPKKSGQIYGVEFSPNGELLYGTSYDNRALYQWNLEAGGENEISASRTLLDSGSNILIGSLQLAPDGKIYIARYPASYLSVIDKPNEIGLACKFQNIGISLNGKISRLGLPSFIQSYFNTKSDTINAGINIGFAGKNICIGDTVIFAGYVDSLKEVFFEIEGKHYSGTTVKYAFHTAGTYEIKMYYKSYFMRVVEDYRVVTQTVEVFGKFQKMLPSDTTFCNSVTIAINIDSFSSVVWQPTIYSGGQATITEEGLAYIFVTDNKGCKFTDSVFVHKLPIPIADFIADSVCLGDLSTLTSTSTISDGNIAAYRWELSDGSTLSGEIVTHNFANSGLFTVKHLVVSDNGCADTLEKVDYAMVRELPVADFEFHKAETPDSTELVAYQFTNKSAGENLLYFWQFEHLGTSEEENPYLEFWENTQINVRLEIEDSFGCINSVEKQVTAALSSNLYVPDVFSPNEDGLNDVFKPVGLPFAQKYKMEIFNRWGELLFVSEDVNLGWDGTYMGEAVQQGVYLYKIIAIYYNGELHTDKGTLTLLR